MFYLPSTQVEHHNPSLIKLSYEDIYLQTNTDKVHGWYFPSKTPRALVLFFHGNGENLSSHYLTLSWLPVFNVSYFIFDYPGYGRSSGSTSPRSTVESGKAALQWATKKAEDLKVPLIVFAQSLGGAIALRSLAETEKREPLSKVIIDSSFLSYQDAANQAMKKGWLTWPFQWLAYVLISDEYAPEKSFDKLKNYPLLVIHGTDDEVVPYKLGKQIYDEHQGPKDLWSIEEGKHIDVFSDNRKEYRTKFLKLIREISKK